MSILALILVSAAVLRYDGIDFNLPYLQHPDEPNKVITAQKMFKSGYYNPEWFKKPSLFIYLNTALYFPYFLHGKSQGRFASRDDIPAPDWLTGGVGKVDDPMLLLMARGLTAFFGVMAVLMMYMVAARMSNSDVTGLVAAALMAVSPTHVAHSRFLTPDMFLIFFILLFFYSCLILYEKGRLRDYILGGLSLGLVVGTKYNGIVVGRRWDLRSPSP